MKHLQREKRKKRRDTIRASMKRRRQNPKHVPFHLMILVTVAAFLILVITMILVVTVIWLAMEAGMIHSSFSERAARNVILALLGISSILVGTIVSFIVGHISLKPLAQLINGMNRLGRGEYGTRIYLGEHKMGRELADSFNKLAEELGNTEMLRSDFVNNFSHEFKTPIVSIYGFAKLLQRGRLEDGQAREYISIIEQESGRLADMATNVLNMTKVENQTILTDVREYNLSEQIRRCVLLLEKKWSAKNLEMACEFNEHFIGGNEEMLQQVWINLLDNAIKFSPENGSIVLWIQEEAAKTEEEPGKVTVFVKNNGPVIREEDRERIFRKFYQSDTSHASQGTGIGLAVVRKIVELHGGVVRADSTERETVFIVELPQAQTDSQ